MTIFFRLARGKCVKLAFQQAIHISSKIEILEHEKEKTIVKAKAGFTTKRNPSPSCPGCKVGPLFEVSGRSKRLPRMRPRFEAT
ncbi:hypothetical protein AVEN_223343-1 [Araneus ventricosus]|uniref:Uncharacterized protein n=1 Tax=Araneus ventricosus TaxID=182803 RepID=A0A4Y2SLS2_ARAVE|nr:hypothetical protein AVEN_223343-1 [Araneus ventricosus]